MGGGFHAAAYAEAQPDEGLGLGIQGARVSGGLAEGLIGAHQLGVIFLHLQIEFRRLCHVFSRRSYCIACGGRDPRPLMLMIIASRSVFDDPSMVR